MKPRHIILFLIVIIGFCSFLFTSFYNQAKQEAIKHINNEQLLHARHAARGIEDFFNNWTRTLTALSESSPVIKMDKAGKENIKLLYKSNQERIRAITRVDAAGRIIYTFPFNPEAVGRDISNQAHVREIMRTHTPVVSDVFFAVQGYDTIALHVPVFRNKTFQGTIAITINFQTLAKRYLEGIKIGKTGYARVTSRKGMELYCPVPGHTGKSVFENYKDFPSILAMAEDMLKGHQGATIYTFDEIRDGKVEVVKKHAVFMPIHFGNTFWSVVVASPEDEIIASLEDFRNNLILVIGLLLLGGVLFSYYGLKAWLIIGEEKKRHRAEEALRESEERFKTLSDKTPLGMCLIDIDGRYEYVNPAFVKIFGYDLSDIPTGKEWFRAAYPDPEYRREVMSDWKEDLSSYPNLEIRPRIYEVRCKGGAFRTIMFRPVTLPSGKQLIIYEDITERKQAEKQLQDTLESLRKAVGATMQVMVAAVETRDPYTSGHQKRSADLARAIAAEMGLPPEKIEGIRMAGSIHDIGKLSIPAEILSKPTKLSEIEFSLIKEHAKKGYEMLKDVESPWPLAEIVRQHHERIDGSGYPRNLKGDDILIEARILSVADVVEAMASHRPYRPGLGIDAALNEIEKNRGILYDNVVADACLRLFREKGFKLEGLDYKR